MTTPRFPSQGQATLPLSKSLALSLLCLVTGMTTCAAQTKMPLEFTPIERPKNGDPCAPAVICESASYSFPECRRHAITTFGAGRYFMYRWDRTLPDPVPLLAIGSTVARGYSAAGCVTRQSPLSNDDIRAERRSGRGITVLSRRYAAFFKQDDSSFFWGNAQRQNLWLDLYLSGITTPTPPPIPVPLPPMPDPKPPRPQPDPPTNPNPRPPAPPSSGNVVFKGTSGYVLSTFPQYSALQGCRLTNGGCSAWLPPGTLLRVSVSPYDEMRNKLSHVSCVWGQGSMNVRGKDDFSVTVPSGGEVVCNVFYAEAGGNTISVVGANFYGTPVVSVPTGKISCNGTTENTCQARVGVGQLFELRYPEFIQMSPSIGAKRLSFCQYYCESGDGQASVRGPKGKRDQKFGVVSKDWRCTAEYYEFPCYQNTQR